MRDNDNGGPDRGRGTRAAQFGQNFTHLRPQLNRASLGWKEYWRWNIGRRWRRIMGMVENEIPWSVRFIASFACTLGLIKLVIG